MSPVEPFGRRLGARCWSVGQMSLTLNWVSTLNTIVNRVVKPLGIETWQIDWTFREPDDTWSLARQNIYHQGGSAASWHHDDTYSDRASWLFSWANMLPTEIRRGHGKILRGLPGEVVLFDNRYYEHRPPREGLENVALVKDRYFARATLSNFDLAELGYR